MKSNPAGFGWLQALADNGQWVPPYEWDGYDFTDRLPRGLQQAPTGQVINEPQSYSRMPEVQGAYEPRTEMSDTPDWLQALGDDLAWERSRVLPGPYAGWGGGAMQARRRGLR
jgi:hypothetical protein